MSGPVWTDELATSSLTTRLAKGMTRPSRQSSRVRVTNSRAAREAVGCGDRRSHWTVRGRGGGGPRDVRNVACGGYKNINRDRVGTVADARHVADHTTGPLGQRQLDPLVQIPGDLTEPARNLNNHP